MYTIGSHEDSFLSNLICVHMHRRHHTIIVSIGMFGEDRFKADTVDDLLNVAITRYHAVPDSLYRLSGKVMTD